MRPWSAASSDADDAEGDDAGNGRTRVPRVVWVITALHLVLLLLFATLLPTWRAPDEPQHVDLVLHVADQYDYPAYNGLTVHRGILNSMNIVHFSQASKHLLASDAPPRSSRKSFEELANAAPASLLPSQNQQPQHPPLYYVTVAAAWRAVRAGVPGDALTSYDRQVWILRVLTALFVVPLPLLAWAIADRLRLRRNAAIVAAMVPLAIPELTHISSAVNNDAPLALLGGLVMLPVLRLAAGDLRSRPAFLAGLFAGLGLLTKGFAFVFVLAALLAIAFGARVAGWRRAVVAASIVCSVALAAGGWWWVRNLIVFHRLAPKVRLVPPADDFVPDWGHWTPIFFRAIFRRFWGDFGWYNIALPGVVWVPAALGCLALVVLAFVRGPRALPKPERRTLLGKLIVLSLPAVALFAFVAVQAALSYRRVARIAFVQGRYLFGGVAGFTALVAAGVNTFGARVLRVAPLAALVAVLTLQGVAIARIIGFFWGAQDASVADHVRALVAWSPWAPWFLALLAILGSGLIGVLACAFAANAIRPSTMRTREVVPAPATATVGR